MRCILRGGGSSLTEGKLHVEPLITVETDLFEHREVKPHFINPGCFGEDFAAWLKERLSVLLPSEVTVSPAMQEDYGWGFCLHHGKDSFWVAVSYVGNGPAESPPQWVISLLYDPGIHLVKRIFHKRDRATEAHLREVIRQAVRSNPAIKIVPNPIHNPGK